MQCQRFILTTEDQALAFPEGKAPIFNTVLAPESAEEQPNCLMKDTDKLHVGVSWSVALWAVCVELEHLERIWGNRLSTPTRSS